jgi:protein-tyrosine-phosphatase
MAQALGADFRVASAGFIGPGRPSPPAAVAAASLRGIDCAGHVSRTTTRECVAEADAIFIFDRFHARRLRRIPGVDMRRVFWLGDFDPLWSGKRAIIDPWGKSAEFFDQTFARIERCTRALVLAVEEARLSTTSGDGPSAGDRKRPTTPVESGDGD